ncbi:MAG: general secretion pathway protein GspB, partial [Shewanella sp.]
MSILLDAVTRNKQQQSSALPDVVLTPRASYPTPRKAAFPVAKLSLLAVAIALGVGGAWGIANWQQSSSMAVLKANDAHKSNTYQGAVIAAHASKTGSDAVVNQTNRELSTSATSEPEVSPDTHPQDARGTAGFRLAGKVALPREQVLNEQPLSMQGYVNSNISSAQTLSANPATTDPSYDDYLATSVALDETVRQQSSMENMIEPQEAAEPEPIM